MLNRLFPKTIDNSFRGSRLAIWLLAFYSLIKIFQGFESVFNAASTAVQADGIPLSHFGPEASAEVVEEFALLGLNIMILPLEAFVILIRYRAMIPLIYLAMLLVNLAARAILFVHEKPVIGGAEPIGFYVNLGLVGILVLGFALSLRDRSPAARSSEPQPLPR
jgi:hypothetical protein